MELSERTKKILAVVLFLGSVVGIGAALYFVFFKPAASPGEPVNTGAPTGSAVGGSSATFPTGGTAVPRTDTVSPGGSIGGASPIASGGQTKTTELTTGPVEGVTLAGNGSSINYYDPADGRFYGIDAKGEAKLLSDRAFPSATGAAWNKDGDKAVITFPDDAKIIYDFNAETQVSLPSHWQDVQFSPAGNQIIAKSLATDPGSRWLVTSNADGSNVKAFQPLGENAAKVQIAWSPNDQVVAFADTAVAQGSYDRKLIIPIGKNQENFKGLVVEGTGFIPAWAPDGNRLLYSASGDYSDGKPLLWVTDAGGSTMGQNRRSLGLNTWADKCTFLGATTAYCAVPTSLPPEAGLQRALYKDTPDQLYKVDLGSGAISLVAIPEGEKTMESLTVSKDGSSLFFTDAGTGRLERIRLK